ncbi:hypothetical protein ACJW30_01G097900 [Castanea mollissima]
MNVSYGIRANIIVVLIIVANFSLPHVSESSQECKGWLVQSIPTDMPHLPRVPGVLSTGDVFQWLAGNSSKRLDIIAQYWELLAAPDDPHSGDYGYSKVNMQEFGAKEGYDVYKAIENAADRNVNVRLLSHSGVYPEYTTEPSNLASGRPNVKNVTLLLSEWYGSGIVHAEVKELGIYLAGCPTIAKMVETYFDNLWKLAFLNSSAHTKTVWDEQWQINRTVPFWSYFIDPKERCRSPLPPYVEIPLVAGYPTLSDPYMFKMSIQTPGYSNSTLRPHFNYLSFAPPEEILQFLIYLFIYFPKLSFFWINTIFSALHFEITSLLLFGTYQAEEQAWVNTIKSVEKGSIVRINTMDWLGQSEYMTPTVYWSSISSAISEVVFSKHATVKLLVAYWKYSISNADQYLKSLLDSNVLCSYSKYNECAGKVVIKYYMVPGFNLTGPAKFPNGTSTGNIYPDFTRVNHGKYVVSDLRAHFATSNLVWDYFYVTAGVSFGTYTPAIVSQMQQVFDADWNSPYAVPIKALQHCHANSR